jgi:anti-sigma regulatory factor (Ser/Thr protein kinase)
VNDDTRHASLELPATTGAPRVARRFTVETLQRWGVTGVIDTAELVVSEMVTNALRHARTGSRLELSESSGCLRIEVVDFGRGGAVKADPELSDLGGRGLMLVEAMTRRWGARHDGNEHLVWCEIPL